jgi:hypothetical protein
LKILILAIAILILPAVCIAQDATTMPDGPGKEIIQKACIGCHSIKVVLSKRATHDEWAALVDQMISRGAEVPDSQVDVVVQYLSTNYGPSSPPPATPSPAPPPSEPKPDQPSPKSTQVTLTQTPTSLVTPTNAISRYLHANALDLDTAANLPASR